MRRDLFAKAAPMMVLLFASNCWAQFTPRTFTARYASTSPTIDGDLSDSVWQLAQPIDEFFEYKSGGDPAAADATARILWDDQNLYVGFQMFETDIRSSCGLVGQCGHDASLFLGDVIELFVKEQTGPTTYYEFEWSPNGDDFDAQFDTRFGPPGTAFESMMTSGVQVDGTVDNASDQDHSWTAEAAIPLHSLTAFSSVDFGSEWFFTVARYDYFNAPPNPQEELMMSTPGDPTAPMGGVTHGFHTYEIYDLLRFTASADINRDQSIDCGDIDAIVTAIANGDMSPTLDLNGDGTVDSADITEWRQQAGAINLPSGNAYLPADANLDGVVDGLDFILWNENKFTNSPFWCRGDFDANGVVDGQDFIIWNANKFTASATPQTVPEPTGVFMMVLACIGALRNWTFCHRP